MGRSWRHCKRGRALAALLLALAAVAPAAGAGGAVPGPAWTAGWEAGLARARAEGRPAFVYFQAVWCSWCHRYERETLADARVRAFLEARTVPVLVDYDARPDLFRRLGGRGLPYTVLVDGEGRPLGAFTGVLSPEDLLSWVESRLAARAAGVPAREAAPARAHAGFGPFRRAFLDHVETLYDPETGTLAGRFESGAGLKRPSPLTWLALADEPAWRARAARAVRREVSVLLDRVDGGFFYFLDPHRAEPHRETAKLLEANAWMAAWAAVMGRRLDDAALRRAARSGIWWIALVARDGRGGGFFQSQVADARYYGLPPRERLRAAPPPVDPLKRADANAQAAWALAIAAGALGEPRALELAREALGFVLGRLHAPGGGLRHLAVAGPRPLAGAPVPARVPRDLPEDLLWAAAAARALGRADPAGRWPARAEALARRLAARLEALMARPPPDPRLAALTAWVCVPAAGWPRCPAGAFAWALAGLTVGAGTAPDDLALGYAAWAWHERGAPPPALVPRPP